jgi:hypothetical protein
MPLRFSLCIIIVISLHSSCISQTFTQLSKKLQEKSTKAQVKPTTITFHDLRVKLFDSGKLNFVNFNEDTLYLLETYDIQSGGYHGRIWNKNNYIQYVYFYNSGFNYYEKTMFTEFTIDLIQRWDIDGIREEERLNSGWTPVYLIYGSRIIFSNKPKIDYLKFKRFFNSKRD